jgi:hypothetical protein
MDTCPAISSQPGLDVDRECKPRILNLDHNEYKVKLALIKPTTCTACSTHTSGLTCIWVAINRFDILDKSHSLIIKGRTR